MARCHEQKVGNNAEQFAVITVLVAAAAEGPVNMPLGSLCISSWEADQSRAFQTTELPQVQRARWYLLRANHQPPVLCFSEAVSVVCRHTLVKRRRDSPRLNGNTSARFLECTESAYWSAHVISLSDLLLLRVKLNTGEENQSTYSQRSLQLLCSP